MNLRVLIIDRCEEDVLFLQDVLAEIPWINWIHTELFVAADWDSAARILLDQPVDIVLLALQPVQNLRLVPGHIPVVLLLDSADDAFTFLRDGAQDFLLKREIDCGPLAHAIRAAIQRHKLLTAARASRTMDPLTGFLEHNNFMSQAQRDRNLAEILKRRFMVAIAEPRDESDLAIIEAADRLRGAARPTDLLGRLSSARFALSGFEEPFERPWPSAMRVGVSIFDPGNPVSLGRLLTSAAFDLAPIALAMRR